MTSFHYELPWSIYSNEQLESQLKESEREEERERKRTGTESSLEVT